MYRIVIIIELLEIFLRIQFMLNMYWRSGANLAKFKIRFINVLR